MDTVRLGTTLTTHIKGGTLLPCLWVTLGLLLDVSGKSSVAAVRLKQASGLCETAILVIIPTMLWSRAEDGFSLTATVIIPYIVQSTTSAPGVHALITGCLVAGTPNLDDLDKPKKGPST